ncbi:MAG: hypothetical protein P0S94_02880 [Simkaniaceae bacterium]|nr:hypothetical protein [Simkaniaceae bacterium]
MVNPVYTTNTLHRSYETTQECLIEGININNLESSNFYSLSADQLNNFICALNDIPQKKQEEICTFLLLNIYMDTDGINQLLRVIDFDTFTTDLNVDKESDLKKIIAIYKKIFEVTYVYGKIALFLKSLYYRVDSLKNKSLLPLQIEFKRAVSLEYTRAIIESGEPDTMNAKKVYNQLCFVLFQADATDKIYRDWSSFLNFQSQLAALGQLRHKAETMKCFGGYTPCSQGEFGKLRDSSGSNNTLHTKLVENYTAYGNRYKANLQKMTPPITTKNAFSIDGYPCDITFVVELKNYPTDSDESTENNILKACFSALFLNHSKSYNVGYTRMTYRGTTYVLQRIFTPVDDDTAAPVIAHMHSTDLKKLLPLIGNKFDEIRKLQSRPSPAWSLDNNREIAPFAYLFSLAAPFFRGSASILETYLAAFYKVHRKIYDKALSDDGSYINPDLEAMISTSYGEFMENFPKSFNLYPM